MLYVTTRDDRDAYTSYRAMCEDVGPDGGRYVPFSLPAFSGDDFLQWKEKTFSQCVADVLNLFFSSRLTGWDVDFCIGRYPVHLLQMNHRIVIAELWRNIEGEFDYVVRKLAKVIVGQETAITSNWMCVAVRIAFLFGVYEEMLRTNAIEPDALFDVSVLSGDFSEPMAVYYAKKMGLPVGSIVCTCTDSSAAWDLLHRGSFSPIGTSEELRLGLERLILDVFGIAEVKRFVECCNNAFVYALDEEQLPLLNPGFFSTVAGDNRAASTINSIYRTSGYIANPELALCFGGLQDYRSRTGESQISLLLSQETPLNSSEDILKITGIKQSKLEQLVNS